MPPELQSAPPKLPNFMPPRLHARSVPPELPSSIPLHLHVPPRPQARSTAREGREVLCRVASFLTRQNEGGKKNVKTFRSSRHICSSASFVTKNLKSRMPLLLISTVHSLTSMQ